MPRVYLNHFFVMTDLKTFDALAKSAFLRDDFAVVEQRTTTSQNQTWSGIYLYGSHTYIEFLPVGALPGQNEGDCSIAFGVDGEQEIGFIENALSHESVIPTESSLVNRLSNGSSVPWFYMVTPKKIVPAPWFETWVMEYHPDFLSKWNANLPPRTASTNREAILERYKAKITTLGTPKPQLFRDVLSLSIALPDTDRVLFDHWLRLLGYTVTAGLDSSTYTGPGIAITVHTTALYNKGMIDAHVGLTSPMTRTTSIGMLELSPLPNNQALWTFQRRRPKRNG